MTREEVPLVNSRAWQVAPITPNTREGLRMAQRILLRPEKRPSQINYDYPRKPSALKL